MWKALLLCAPLWLSLGTVGAAEYDPLATPMPGEVNAIDLTAKDDTRGREIPLKVYLPASAAPEPVVVFSHGLGGNREGSAYLGRHWAGRGYVAVFLQHPGSDDSVWKDQPPAQRMAAMQKAASGQNWLLRMQDVHAVLDRLAKWNAEPGDALAGRLDLTRLGMSGHSFGAQTTQAVSDQAMAVALRLTGGNNKDAMKTHVLKGSKQEIAESLVRIDGEVREAIVFVDDAAPAGREASSSDTEDIFAEMRSLMVDVQDVDDSRETIYTPMEGE